MREHAFPQSTGGSRVQSLPAPIASPLPATDVLRVRGFRPKSSTFSRGRQRQESEWLPLCAAHAAATRRNRYLTARQPDDGRPSDPGKGTKPCLCKGPSAREKRRAQT